MSVDVVKLALQRWRPTHGDVIPHDTWLARERSTVNGALVSVLQQEIPDVADRPLPENTTRCWQEAAASRSWCRPPVVTVLRELSHAHRCRVSYVGVVVSDSD